MPFCKVQKLVCERGKPAQNFLFVRPFRPALPAALHPVERAIFFLAPLEHSLCRRSQTWHVSEECLEKTGYANVQVSQLLLQHIVYVFAVLCRVRKAARVNRQGSLLEERGRAGWRRRLGDSIVHSIPNEFIGLKFEDGVEQRSYSFGVEIVRADRCMKPRNVMEEGFAPIPRVYKSRAAGRSCRAFIRVSSRSWVSEVALGLHSKDIQPVLPS